MNRPPILNRVGPIQEFNDQPVAVKEGELVMVLCECGAEGVVKYSPRLGKGSKNMSIHCTECTNHTKYVRGWPKALEAWERGEYDKSN